MPNLTKQDIITTIQVGQPVSIIRYGDGESIVLNSTEGLQQMELASTAVIKRQTGYDPTMVEVKAIRQNLIDAYTGADIIGIPMHVHKTSKHWTNAKSVLDANVPLHSEQYCDIDVAYQMLEEDGYHQILQNRRVLNYISCRNLDEGFQQRYNIHTVNRYEIAPEMKFTSGYDGFRHYPTQFNRVQRWMDVVGADEGKLLLVGAGVIGKIYCNWWRDRGGVAFDIGGVMDIFAGKVTRGPERGLDKDEVNPVYKL